MFKLQGICKDRFVEVSWNSGKLGGDQIAVMRITARAVELEGEPVGPPTGPNTITNHISDPLSALFIIDEILDEIRVIEGEVPEAPVYDLDEDDPNQPPIVY